MEQHKMPGTQNQTLKIAIYFIGVLFLVSMIFMAGMVVGSSKTGFRQRWAENYERNFGPGRRGPISMMAGRNFQSHGNFATIIKVEGKLITVKDREGIEKVVITNESTVINRGTDKVSLADLKIDDKIVVIGEANSNGQIEAKLIRIFPFDFPSSLGGNNIKS